jgi:hypothetical protein
MKALLWKEWREGRFLWLAYALLIVIPVVVSALWGLSSSGYGLSNIELIVYGLLWCFFALSSPAYSIAGEKEKRTLEFLDGLPVSRKQVWTVKVVFSLAGLAALGLWTLLLKLIVSGKPWFVQVTGAAIFYLFCLALLLFSFSVLCSSLIRNGITAMAGAIAAGGVFLTAAAVFCDNIGLWPALDPSKAGICVLLFALFFGPASLVFFASAEVVPGKGLRRILSPGGITTLALVVLPVSGCLYWIHLAPLKSDVHEILQLEAFQGGDVYFTAASVSGKPAGVWSVTSDGIFWGRAMPKPFSLADFEAQGDRSSCRLLSPLYEWAYPRRIEHFYCFAERGVQGTPGSQPLLLDVNPQRRRYDLVFRKWIGSPCRISALCGTAYSSLAVIQNCPSRGAHEKLWIVSRYTGGKPVEVREIESAESRITGIGWSRSDAICCVQGSNESRILEIRQPDLHGFEEDGSPASGAAPPRFQLTELFKMDGRFELLAIHENQEAIFLTDLGNGDSLISCGPMSHGPLDPAAVVIFRGVLRNPEAAEAVAGKTGFLCAFEEPTGGRLVFRPWEGEGQTIREGAAVSHIALSPDGSRAVYLLNGTTLAATDLKTGQSRVLAENVTLFSGPGSFVQPAKVVFAGKGGEIRVAHLDTGKTERIF